MAVHPPPKATVDTVLGIVGAVASLTCFVFCLVCAIIFYRNAMDWGRSELDPKKESLLEESTRKCAEWCGGFCFLGVMALAVGSGYLIIRSS